MTFVRLAGCNALHLGLGCVAWCDTPTSWDAEAGDELDVEEILAQAHLPRLCLTGGEPLLQIEGVAALVHEAHRRGVKVHLETNGTLALAGTADPVVDSAGGACRDPLGLAWESTGAAPGSSARARERRVFDWVVVSPKPPGYFIMPDWEGLIDELKLVVDPLMNETTAERLAADHPEALVSVQPLWEEGRRVRRAGPFQAGKARPGGAAAALRYLPAPGGTAAGGTGRSRGDAAGESGDSLERAIRLVMTHPDWRLSLQVHKYLGMR
jgi:hypothetical protein